MNDFNAKNFSDLYATNMGQDIWRFLNSEASLACMKTTTYLRRPAIEGLQPLLINEFQDDIRPDRLKQMIGKMVRQILENQGYILDQSRVKVRVGDLFATGSRYKKRN